MLVKCRFFGLFYWPVAGLGLFLIGHWADFFFHTDPATLSVASPLNIHWIFAKVLLKDHCLLMSQQYKTYRTELTEDLPLASYRGSLIAKSRGTQTNP